MQPLTQRAAKKAVVAVAIGPDPFDAAARVLYARAQIDTVVVARDGTIMDAHGPIALPVETRALLDWLSERQYARVSLKPMRRGAERKGSRLVFTAKGRLALAGL